MTLPVFLIDPDRLRSDGPVVLDGPEGRHAALVRRVGVGEQVEVADGLGVVARCQVVEARRDALTLQVLRREREPAPTPRIVVAQALPKGERGERAVEAMTEVGVDEIVPWSAARCVTQWRGERAAKGLARWRSTAREAAKQSRRRWLPTVAELADTAEVAARVHAAALAVVLHERADEPLPGSVPAGGEVVLVVGPEGGLAEDELATFAAAGARTCRLGPTVLRTSTAGVVGAAVLLSRSGRW